MTAPTSIAVKKIESLSYSTIKFRVPDCPTGSNQAKSHILIYKKSPPQDFIKRTLDKVGGWELSFWQKKGWKWICRNYGQAVPKSWKTSAFCNEAGREKRKKGCVAQSMLEGSIYLYRWVFGSPTIDLFLGYCCFHSASCTIPSLLEHSVAEPTKHRFLQKNMM